jgi:hypothetical protein
MKTISALNHNFAPSEAPIEAVQSAAYGLATAAHTRMDETRRQAEEITAIGEQHRYELRKLLGESGYNEMRTLIRRPEERPVIPGAQPESHKAMQARRAERKARIHALLGELKISPERVHAINAQTREKIMRTLPRPPTRDEQTITFHRPYDVPVEIREGRASPWKIHTPPFNDWSWWNDGWTSGNFHFAPELFLNSDLGIAGNNNHLYNTDASDFDHSQMEYNASVGFWYQMPQNGKLDIWIEGFCDAALHHLTLVDEWGSSDAFSWQENYLVVKCDGLANDPWQKALMSWFKYDGDGEGAWNNTYIPHGTICWAHLITQNWFPKDSWVHINAGTTSWHRATTNDMQIWSSLRFAWLIKSVHVSAIP